MPQTKPADQKSKRPRITSGIRVGNVGVDMEGMRSLAENHPTQFMGRMQELIDSGELTWGRVTNLGRMFHTLADVQIPVVMDVLGQQRAIMASAFPLLSGHMTIAGINAGYESEPTIGEQLVNETESNKKIDIYASITEEDTNTEQVREGADFPEIGAGEGKYEIRHKRNGRRISITAETIEENDIPGIVGKVDALGTIPAKIIEKQTLRRVCDIDGSGSSPAEPYVLRPNGSGTALYSTTANTPGVQAPSGTRIANNALVDASDLEAARVVLASMLDSGGDRIAIPMSQCLLLVPDALVGTADMITLSERTPGVENEFNPWGPRGRHRPTVLSSARLDDLSTTTWYLGAFKKQFKRKWKIKFEHVTLTNNTESFLRSRIAFQARVAWDVEIGATDYVYVVQCLADTTAP